MISDDDLAALLMNWRDAQREVEVALLGPGVSVKFSGVIDDISKREFAITSNQHFVHVGFGKEADAHSTVREHAEGAARYEMEQHNLEAVLELRPSDEISCSISVRAPILYLPQSKSFN